MTIGVMGAGAIGTYVGGRLAAAGTPTILVGRAALAEQVARHGLRITDYRGADLSLGPERITIATEPAALAACETVLVTVKGGDTAAAGAALAAVLRPGAVVVSFQNGVRNPEVLRAALPGHRVLAGMVQFNVLRGDDGRFHQGTSGKLAIERADDDAADALARTLEAAGLPARVDPDMQGVLWGKLLVNLNNAVNALAGVPIRAMLRQRDYRRVMAAALREAIDAVTAAGIRPRLDPPLPPRLLPALIGLPDLLFRIAARPMIKVDPEARSSMWDDLARGRTTEIDGLNGEIVRLAAAHGRAAPVNAAIVGLIKQAEGKGSPQLAAAELRRRVGV